MAWSIKKPLGGKKSIVRQIARVTVAPVAAPVLQTLGLKNLAREVNDGVWSKKNLQTVGTAGQIVGASIIGGQLIGGLSPATTTVSRYNVVTNQPYTQTITNSFWTRLGGGLSKIAGFVTGLVKGVAPAAALLPRSGGGTSPGASQIYESSNTSERLADYRDAIAPGSTDSTGASSSAGPLAAVTPWLPLAAVIAVGLYLTKRR